MALAVLQPIVHRLIHHYLLARSWPWLTLIAVIFLLIVFVTWFREYAAWVRYACVKCPNCGARNWSKGYYSGFGL